METLIGFGLGIGFSVLLFLFTSEDFWKGWSFGSPQTTEHSDGFIQIDEVHFMGDENISNNKKRRRESLKRLEKFKARNRFYR